MASADPRLLFVSPSAYPLGGLASWLDYLVPGLGDAGYEVFVALVHGRHQDAAGYRGAHPLPNLIQVENRSGSREGRVRSLSEAIARVSPDIVASVNIADTYDAVARANLKDGVSARAVMTLHGLQADLFEDARRYHRTLAGVVCSNRLACRLVEVDAGIDPSRVLYAPYGVELSTLEQTHGSPGPLRIAVVGRLERFQKRVQDIPKILDALEALDFPHELLIAGDGPDREALLSELDAIRGAGRVSFLGALDYSDLVEQVYLSADVLLVTSFWETGPLVIWEAMAHGMPVVTSAYVGSGLEGALAHETNCLIFPIGDARAAAEQLARVADLGLRQRLIEGGRRLLRERYSRRRSVDAWGLAFKRLLAQEPSPAGAATGVFPQSGRLDRLLGTSLAEDVRTVFGLHFDHQDAGGEWPHSYGEPTSRDPEFWRLAEGLDRPAGDEETGANRWI